MMFHIFCDCGFPVGLESATNSKLPLKSGWMTVEEALNLPEPDVSWMDQPMPRSRFTGWLQP